MYERQIIKQEQEKHPQDAVMGLQNFGRNRPIFQAVMNSDSAIEILQHLHDLKEREREINTPKREN